MQVKDSPLALSWKFSINWLLQYSMFRAIVFSLEYAAFEINQPWYLEHQELYPRLAPLPFGTNRMRSRNLCLPKAKGCRAFLDGKIRFQAILWNGLRESSVMSLVDHTHLMQCTIIAINSEFGP